MFLTAKESDPLSLLKQVELKHNGHTFAMQAVVLFGQNQIQQMFSEIFLPTLFSYDSHSNPAGGVCGKSY